MEIEFGGKTGGKPVAAPKTRLYDPKRRAGSRGKGGKGERRDETVVDEDGYRIRISADEIKPMSRFGLILCGFAFSGMLLFTLTGYERITRAYADINALNYEIEQTNLRIAGLDVQIECAVTIQQAQEAAERFGMQYPQQAQYVKTGDYIPIAGTFAGATGDTGAGGAGGTGNTGVPDELEIPDASGDLLG